MSIRLPLLADADRLVPVAELAEARTGKRPSPSTVWRWCRRGIRGGKLSAVLALGRWHTTPTEFAEFMERQTAAMLMPRSPHVDAPDDDQLRAEGLL